MKSATISLGRSEQRRTRKGYQLNGAESSKAIRMLGRVEEWEGEAYQCVKAGGLWSLRDKWTDDAMGSIKRRARLSELSRTELSLSS